jgi:hypothetical protein
MAALTIPLSEEEMTRLRELAKEADSTPDELVRARVVDWLSQPKEDFLRASAYVLRKNAELYRRLA